MKTLPLTKGFLALVDDADYEKVSGFKWTVLTPKSGKRYAYRRGPRPEQRVIYLHRFIMDAPEGAEVDHRDGDGLNCRRSNLRVCTHKDNSRNLRLRTDNSSGFKGVAFHRKNQNWVARIQVDGRTRHIGSFPAVEEAARAYDAAAIRFFGRFAKLNFEPTSAEGANQ